MKFLHLSDLHIGKRLNEQSLIDDQKYILDQIVDIAKAELPDAVLIAGDVYDKSIPSGEAVCLFDDFLFELSRLTRVFVISGNHDSAERLSFASRMIEGAGIYISRSFSGNIQPITLKDEYGECDVYLLPFVKPTSVRRFFPDFEIESYTDAVAAALSDIKRDVERRRVLVTHQFVTGAERSESEEVSVGGADNVDASVFEGFDYVALGHLHRAQSLGGGKIRYCGTPLKYSFSECRDKKSVTVLELREKGTVEIREVALTPLCDLFELRGSYNELMARDFYEGADFRDSYLRIVLTDEDEVPDAKMRMDVVYPHILALKYDNKRTSAMGNNQELVAKRGKSPREHFADFYKMRQGKEMTDEQRTLVERLIEELWEE